MRTRAEGGVIAVVVLVFVAASASVLFANWLDWDQFLSFSEVDRRAWLQDRALPLWSYQLCAGVTRIGDPQSFGLSPLFVLVLVFGTFWGTKLLVIGSMAVGLFAATGLFELFARARPGGQLTRAQGLTLATLFVFSNYLLWHLLSGHVTYVSIYFALAILYFTVAGFLVGLRRRDFALGVLASWQLYAGAFLPATFYLLLPFFLSFALFLALRCIPALRAELPGDRNVLARLASAFGFHLLGLVLGSYKLFATWSHQLAYPRKLTDGAEVTALPQLLAYQLLPTWDGDWLHPIGEGGAWALHEYSAFSLFPLLLVFYALRRLWHRRSQPGGSCAEGPERNPLALLIAVFLAISTAFALGDFSGAAPFTLLNRYLLDDSLRGVGRFGVGVTLSLALTSALWLGRRDSGLPAWACTLLLALLALNLTGFSWLLSSSRTLYVAGLDAEPPAAARLLRIIQVFPPDARLDVGSELRTESTSRMYPTLRAGEGVVNCYNPLMRPALAGWPPGRDHRIIDPRFGAPSAACLEESSFEQNHISISPVCPQDVCVNVGWLNPRDRTEGFHYDPQRRRFCRGEPGGRNG